MGKKSKDSNRDEPLAALQSLFSVDNPFRRKPQPEVPAAPPPPELGLGERPPDLGAVGSKVQKKRTLQNAAEEKPDPSESPKSISKKLKKMELREEDGQRRKKRKRDEIEQEYEKRKYGATEEDADEGDAEKRRVLAVGEKRKADDVVAADLAMTKEESFDDESKLLRTVFLGNLPLKTKKKALLKEFAKFGEVESVRIRSVPLLDSKLPRKGAIMKGKINEAVDCVHAYIVFKDEQSANAALSNNMELFGGNHIRVDMACPPRKKLRGEIPLYDRKRTVFVGNLPFDVKDEELYQLFCGASESESNLELEAIRVIRDPHTSLGKGIAYVLFRTRDAANSVCKKKDLKIRDRILRVCHAKSSDVTPSKRKGTGPEKGTPRKKLAATNGGMPSKNDTPKPRAASLSYQGVRSSKSGVLKKSNLQRPIHKQGKPKSKETAGTFQKARKTKRPAVAARKAKQTLKKRKQDNTTPENSHRKKKARIE